MSSRRRCARGSSSIARTPTCNACHGVIDPYGLALENFTATGRWRDHDDAADAPIDASTTLPSGKPITGSVELTAALLEREDQLVQALAHKLMMYAVGRELEYFDMPQVRAVVQDAADEDYRFSAIVTGIVRSDAFRMQGAAAHQIRFSSGVFGGNGRERVRRVRRVAAMFLTKKHLSRRTVLQAAGVSLGLPLLDAMIPAATALAQTAAAPKLRAGFFYLPHGAIMWNTSSAPRWTIGRPSGAGADFKLSPILAAARVVQALCDVVRQHREQGAARARSTRSCPPRGSPACARIRRRRAR